MIASAAPVFTGGIPWKVLLMLPIHLLAGCLGIGLAALLLGTGWDRAVRADDPEPTEAGPAPSPQLDTREGPP